VATALGIFSTFQAYNYVSLFTERDPSFPMLLLLNVTYWYAWALLVPPMLWMARRYRFDRHGWRRAVLAHVPAVVVITALHAVLTCGGPVGLRLSHRLHIPDSTTAKRATNRCPRTHGRGDF
jgi:hypothetical protein